MPATMKALVKAKAEPGLWLQDVPMPQIGINDVLIQIEKAAICGTDVHIYKWDAWAQKTIPNQDIVDTVARFRRVFQGQPGSGSAFYKGFHENR